MPLMEALRISMSIPLFFTAVRHGERDDVCVDSGVQLNYPVKLFDRKRYIAKARSELAATPSTTTGKTPASCSNNPVVARICTTVRAWVFAWTRPPKSTCFATTSRSAASRSSASTTAPAHLWGALMNQQEKQHLHSDDWQRTVYINTLEVGTTDFDLSDERKQALVEQGIQGAETFCQWFETRSEQPVNRLPPQDPTPQ